MDSKLKELFPLNSPEKVIDLVKNQLSKPADEVDITLISICCGFFENFFTKENQTNKTNFPNVEFHEIDELYKKFKTIVSSAEAAITPQANPKAKKVAESQEPKIPTREKIKKISDTIWHSLLRQNAKDRCHLQSVYSYLTGNKLDSFGFALVTVAACQLLSYKNVHLALAEDHVWIVFGEKSGKRLLKHIKENLI